MTTRARDFKFAGAIVRRLYLVMVGLTKNRLSAQYGWFCHERSHIIACVHSVCVGGGGGEGSIHTHWRSLIVAK